jgi:hypothetical protein
VYKPEEAPGRKTEPKTRKTDPGKKKWWQF